MSQELRIKSMTHLNFAVTIKITTSSLMMSLSLQIIMSLNIRKLIAMLIHREIYSRKELTCKCLVINHRAKWIQITLPNNFYTLWQGCLIQPQSLMAKVIWIVINRLGNWREFKRRTKSEKVLIFFKKGFKMLDSLIITRITYPHLEEERTVKQVRRSLRMRTRVEY